MPLTMRARRRFIRLPFRRKGSISRLGSGIRRCLDVFGDPIGIVPELESIMFETLAERHVEDVRRRSSDKVDELIDSTLMARKKGIRFVGVRLSEFLLGFVEMVLHGRAENLLRRFVPAAKIGNSLVDHAGELRACILTQGMDGGLKLVAEAPLISGEEIARDPPLLLDRSQRVLESL